VYSVNLLVIDNARAMTKKKRGAHSHGSACSHSFGVGCAWERVRHSWLRGVHGSTCGHSLGRLALGVCERSVGLHLHVLYFFMRFRCMFRMFYLDVACVLFEYCICCNSYIRMLQVYVSNVSSISDTATEPMVGLGGLQPPYRSLASEAP
jgi:hypothetical protein